MKKIVLALLILMMILSGCSTKKQDEEKPYYQFVDSMGNEVILMHKPQRVAVLFSSLAQIYQLAGGEIAVTVGDSVTRGFAGSDVILVNETAGLKIDFETLVAAEPDFVIVSADLSAQTEAAQMMKQLGVPVALMRDESFEDYLYLLKIFTDITDNKAVYQTYGVELQQQIDTLLADISSKNYEEINYLFVRAGSGYSSTKARTADNHFACVMLDQLGAKNIVDSESALTESISIEYILQKQPDIIIIAPQGNEDNAKAYIANLFSQDGYKELNAVKNNKVYFVSKELFNYKPNQNWFVAYQTLANLLYGN